MRARLSLNYDPSQLGSAGSEPYQSFLASIRSDIATLLGIDPGRVRVYAALGDGMSTLVDFDLMLESNSTLAAPTPDALYQRLQSSVVAGNWSLGASSSTAATCIFKMGWTPTYNSFWCLNYPCPLPDGASILLPASTPNHLMVLYKVRPDGSTAPVARSYDGQEWENSVGPYDGGRADAGLTRILACPWL